MNFFSSLRWALPLLLLSSAASADWIAKDGLGGNVTFDAFVNGSKTIPKHTLVGPTGVQIGTIGNPFYTAVTGTAAVTQSGTWTVSAAQTGAWSFGLSAALPAGANTIGAVTQASGPWTQNLTQINGAAISTSNTMPVNCVTGCSAPTSDSALATYSASTPSYSTGATASDVACVSGSASKVVRVRKIGIEISGGTAANIPISVVRRSTANAAGTTIPVVRHDTTDAAATAGTNYYGAAPGSTGTLVGTIATLQMNAAPPTSRTLDFGSTIRGGKTIVLRGTAEWLCITQVVAVSALAGFAFEWTEE